MPLNPHQSRVLQEISEQLASSDPRLARELTGPPARPSTAREVVVVAVLLVWMVLAFVPLALGIASSHPILVGVGVLTFFIGGPAMIWATVRWVHRHRFVRFRRSGEQR